MANLEQPETSDNTLFTSNNLETIVISSDKFGSVQIYPTENKDAHGGISIFESISIKESLFSPTVSGILVVYDIGSFIENYNIEGFEDIAVTFKKAKDGRSITFRGIITDVTLLTDDSVLANKMNFKEYVRMFSITFMNKDLFIANYLPPQSPKIDDNSSILSKDFVGWISRK